MKKFFMLAVSMLVLTATSFLNNVSARDLNSEQLALRNEIMSFLKEEGYMPEIDSDGDIKFKSEGNNFYVTVSATDENPMYVTLFRVFSNPDDYSADVLLRATKSLNHYKGVKISCYDSSFRISSELYLRSAELFKQGFYKMVSQINNLRSDVMEECRNAAASGDLGGASVSEIPFIVTEMKVANVDKEGNIIQGYDSSIYDFKSKYLQPKITIKPFRTSGTYTVYVKLYKGNVLQRNTNTSPENYTYSRSITINGSGPQTFELIGWGSNNAGFWSIDTYRFEIWINDYCVGSKTFKVI